MMIEATNLTKIYGQLRAIDSLNFSIDKGEIIGFLGPNGAGKTTTMKILTGYMPPTEGTAKIAGYDVVEQPMEAKRRIGYLPENPPLYLDMTARAYLNFVADLKKIDKRKKKAQVDMAIERAGLKDVQKRLIKNMSKGYRQRVGIAQAIVANPEVLIFDEPTVGLDPRQIREIRDLIKELGRDHTVILSTHILPEVSMICQKVMIINKGKIVAVDTPDNLSMRFQNSNRFVLKVKGPVGEVKDIIRNTDGVTHVDVTGQKGNGIWEYVVSTENAHDVREPIFYAMADKRYPILEMHFESASLEDIFLQLTTTEQMEEVAS